MTSPFSRSLLASALSFGIAFSAAAPAFAEPDKQVQADAEQYKYEALKLLEQLVNIDTGSGYEPGLTQVRDIVVA
ncbi:glutamate carboxypeptidase, partial [Pseudomonas graminis]